MPTNTSTKVNASNKASSAKAAVGAAEATETVAVQEQAKKASPDLHSTKLFINRELSWIKFNERVLEEALKVDTPLLERVKFLSIFAGNLDEFFMIRVSGLRHQLSSGTLEAPPDGMSPSAQLAAIREALEPLLTLSDQCWADDLKPKLDEAGIRVLHYRDLKKKQRQLLRRHFEREIFPALTPLAFDPSHPFPHISNLSINLALEIRNPEQDGEECFARLKVPQIFPRLLRIPSEERAAKLDRLGLEHHGSERFVWIEEVIAANLDLLFPGLEIIDAFPFRVTRDADLEIEEDEAADLMSAMEEVVGQRHFGSAVRLEIDSRTPDRIREMLIQNLELAPYQAFSVSGPIGLTGIMELVGLERPELKHAPFLPHLPQVLSSNESLFSAMRKRDHLLYHPYDSFNPVVDFIRSASRDPKVVTIKQTLYRVGPDSPIVQALMEARENGKQVAVLVELKARFDETNNIVWARQLERAGVHVVYGLMGLKTHAKMCLVVRREKEGLRRYVHLGTGNYNPVTARIYTDFGYFTVNEEIATDMSDLFNRLTGYSEKEHFRRLLVAPNGMRDEILKRIRREVQIHKEEGGGHLIFKLNALVDKRCIQALYRASQAGVKIDLQIRGICCLRPGVEGVSENISVTSIVGRFLEHTRLFYFRNGGNEEIYLGSADLMPRNLDGRVEVLFPVLDERIRISLRDEILHPHLNDDMHGRRLLEDGNYVPLEKTGSESINSQQRMLEHRGVWHGTE